MHSKIIHGAAIGGAIAIVTGGVALGAGSAQAAKYADSSGLCITVKGSGGTRTVIIKNSRGDTTKTRAFRLSRSKWRLPGFYDAQMTLKPGVVTVGFEDDSWGPLYRVTGRGCTPSFNP